jgi:hypothetical protein
MFLTQTQRWDFSRPGVFYSFVVYQPAGYIRLVAVGDFDKPPTFHYLSLLPSHL